MPERMYSTVGQVENRWMPMFSQARCSIRNWSICKLAWLLDWRMRDVPNFQTEKWSSFLSLSYFHVLQGFGQSSCPCTWATCCFDQAAYGRTVQRRWTASWWNGTWLSHRIRSIQSHHGTLDAFIGRFHCISVSQLWPLAAAHMVPVLPLWGKGFWYSAAIRMQVTLSGAAIYECFAKVAASRCIEENN